MRKVCFRASRAKYIAIHILPESNSPRSLRTNDRSPKPPRRTLSYSVDRDREQRGQEKDMEFAFQFLSPRADSTAELHFQSRILVAPFPSALNTRRFRRDTRREIQTWISRHAISLEVDLELPSMHSLLPSQRDVGSQEVFLTVDVCALDGRVRSAPVLRITSAKCDRLKVRFFPSETQAPTVHSTFSNTLRRFSTTQRPLTDLPTEWPQELELPH